MQIDPVAEWRRLSEHYRQMADVQLQELARSFADLTETAQQVLGDQLRLRGLSQPCASGLPAASSTQPRAAIKPAQSATDEIHDVDQAESEPVEYTWKTILCECEELDQVWQIREMLRRCGIESWSEGWQFRGEGGLLYPRILVAADQIDEARAVIARPVPQDVIDDSRMTIPEYKMPHCPACRAEDPVLESTDAVNTWRCEACGRQWSDPAPLKEGPAPNEGP